MHPDFFLERTSNLRSEKNLVLKNKFIFAIYMSREYKRNYTEIIWKFFIYSCAIYRNYNNTMVEKEKSSQQLNRITPPTANSLFRATIIPKQFLFTFIYIDKYTWRIYVRRMSPLTSKIALAPMWPSYIPNRTISTSTLPL